MSMTMEKALEIIVAQAERIYDLEEENKKNSEWFKYYTEEGKKVDELKKEVERLNNFITENVTDRIESTIVDVAS